MALPEPGDEALPTLATLPRGLLSLILLLAADGDVGALVRCAAVCRDWRALLRGGGPWPALRTLRVASPGGRCPFRLAARAAPRLRTLAVLPHSGVAEGGELQALSAAPLEQLKLRGLTALSQKALLSLCVPTLTSLDVSGSRVDAATLAAALQHCPRLKALSADGCPLDRGSRAGLLSQLRAHSLVKLSLRGAGSLLDDAALDGCAASSPHLAFLDVSATALRCVPPAVLALRHLRELRAEDCPDLGNSAFPTQPQSPPALPALAALSLGGCRGLGDAGIRALSALLRASKAAAMERLSLPRLLDLTDASAAELLTARPAADTPLALDVSCCGRLSDAFVTACCRLQLRELRAAGLPRLTPQLLSQLAASGALRHAAVLELDDCEALQRDASAALAEAACAAGAALRRLSLDGCTFDDASAAAVASACPALEELSLVGVASLGDDGMTALATRCKCLHSLAVGGSRGRWTTVSLAAFTALNSLRIVRRNEIYDAEVADAVSGCGAVLQHLSLAACGGVTDASLSALARAAPQLRTLTLTACDHTALHGAPLRCFARLCALTVSSCPAVRCDSLVHALVACLQLMLLRVPIELRLQLAQRVPVRAPPDDGADLDAAPWRPPPLLRLDS